MSADNLSPADPGQAVSPPDLAGKASVQELAESFRASSREATRLAQENNTLKAQLAQGFYPRQEIPQRPATPQERLSDYGVPVDALEEYVNQRLQSAFAPVVQAAGARNKVISQRPDYVNHEAAVANYISQDPELNQRYQNMFAGDPVGAIEWSIDRYTESQKSKVSPDDGKRAKSEAQLPTARSAESRNTDSQAQEMLQAAKKRAMETRRPEDIQRWVSMRYRQGISPGFYQTGHPRSE